MFEVHPIDSLEDPRLVPYRTMRRQLDHFEQEIFITEGDKVVHRLLESSIPVISLLMPGHEVAQFEPLLTQRSERIAVFTAPKAILEKLTGFQLYRGVLGLAKVPPASTLEDILRLATPPRMLVALDGLSNAENLGSVVRNAVAFGVQGLLLNGESAPPYLRRAVRSSMGTIFKLPYLQTNELPKSLRELSRQGIRVVAAHPHSREKQIAEASLTTDCCIVFGSEGHGISPEILQACDETIAIPMQQETDSLNVASASAVFLYEVQRQRTAERPGG